MIRTTLGLFLGVWPVLTLGSLSLWVAPDEVTHLLGVGRELWYVWSGVVRPTATEFALLMAEDQDQTHFKWKNEEIESQIYYSLLMESSDPISLHQPHLNISHQGLVPNRETTWRVTLPCTGHSQADVEVKIKIQFTGAFEDNLEITRIKRCQIASKLEPNQKIDHFNDQVNYRTEPHIVFLAILCGLFGVVVFLTMTIFSVRLKQKRLFSEFCTENNKIQSSLSLNYLHQPLMDQQGQNLGMAAPFAGSQAMLPPLPPTTAPPPLPPPNPPPANAMRYQRMMPMYSDNPPFLSDTESRVTDWVQSQRRQVHNHHSELDPEAVVQILHVERLRLKLGQLLQEGTFGRIYQGTFMTDENMEEDVFIKTVIAGSSSAQSQILIKEATSLYEMNHHHIQCLMASTWDGTSPMLIYPYMAFGNLKKWLQQQNHGGCSTHAVVSMGLQLLKAMQFLHKKKFIHKDIAARNCFLGEGNVLKLSDSALSRDLFPSDYYCLGDNENRPIKWMPIEAIAQKNYSRSSDVWSFGVFLWEVMTRAQQPFSDIDPFEMESYLFEGYRLHQPMNCPDQLYSVLTSCWGTRPMERASVHNLYSQLQNLQKQLQQFV